MGEDEQDWPDERLRAALLAHAAEIALAARRGGPQHMVCARYDPRSGWLGCTLVPLDDPSAQGNGGAWTFYFPAECTTAERVRRFVRDHWEAYGA